MFSYQERMKAVNLLFQYDNSYSTVIRELGYPSKEALWKWYKEYSQNGDLHQGFNKQSKFTDEEKQKAVDYYLEHGKCVTRTVKKLGYPSRPILDKWIKELAPDQKKHCRSGGAVENIRMRKKNRLSFPYVPVANLPSKLLLSMEQQERTSINGNACF